ncbi:MAG: hypothetical protein AAB600_04570 [Patescibacteria group bacterium]
MRGDEVMGSFGGYFKGEKKKKKKGPIKNVSSVGLGSPIISMPEIISKKKPGY